jgi:hypothetical protein
MNAQRRRSNETADAGSDMATLVELAVFSRILTG